MNLIVLFTVLGVALGRPSLGHHLVYSPDGRSFSYSYQTPFFQTLHPSARFYQVPSVVVGPHVKYSLETPPIAVKYVEQANIQLSPEGFVLDTPAVAQAKAEHLAALAREQARAGSGDGTNNEIEPIVVPEEEDDQSSSAVDNDDTVEVKAAVAPSTPFQPANVQVAADGHLVDTPEVAQARAEHLARYAAEAARSVIFAPARYVYSNFAKSFPAADIKVGADGHLLDTPEVAQARAEHLARFASEAARAESAGGDDQSDSQSGIVVDVQQSIEQQQPQQPERADDPPADIRVGADGFVQDTPEVAAAKAQHLAELAKVGSDENDQSDTAVVVPPATIPSYVAYTSPALAYTAFAKYYGPEADIKVGADGFVVETPEVAEAKARHLATKASILAGRGGSYAAASGSYVADTPEVAAARAAHLKAHAEETARAGAGSGGAYGNLVYGTAAPHYFAGHPLIAFRYAPTIGPFLTADGQYLLDTPEVAAEKIKHFAAHARARGF